MRLFLRIALAACILIAAVADLEAQAPATLLADDSAIVRGKLPNGLRYIVRRNAKPEKRAELRLVVNAGSILEDDSQLGLAHFVEHMAFNGTKRFPKADLVNFVERIGMRFGPDLNAYTSFDETVYILTVPTDTARLVDTALDILEDWSHALAFDSAEVRKERGVVIEEWRSGRSASMRMLNKQLPVMLRGSKYARRLAIGTKESLESFPDSVARKFYADWYRPDLMTVIAVGDFDPKQMESSIRTRFARLAPVAAPRERVYSPVPDHPETLVSIESDREYPNASVVMYWMRPPNRVQTVADQRRQMVAGFYDGMVNARFGELTQRPDAPFAFASGGRGSFTRTRDVYSLFAGVKGSDFEKAAQALLVESERITRFGFAQSELDRTRTNYLRSLEQRYAERDKTNSSQLVGQYVYSALRDLPILGIADELALARQYAPTITLAEVNALARTTFTPDNRVIVVASPEKSGITLPSQAAMLSVFDHAKSAPITAYVDSTSDAPLIAKLPAPGKVIAERALPETGILEWKLSNGAKVLLKPTEFKQDEVVFAAQSFGGLSLLPDADVTQGTLATSAVSVGGLGSFNQVTLTKKLTGKRAQIYPWLSDTRQGIGGQASARDIETLFQLAWMRITQPRPDTIAYAAYRNMARASLINQRSSPDAIFRDTITMTMSQHHPRVRLFGPEMFDSIEVGRALAIYKDRFADASGFTFYVVGNFRPDSIRPLVERYIASLPSLNRKQTFKDVGIRPPTGIVNTIVRAGVEPKARTQISFTGPCEYSFENRARLNAMRELLNIRLREVLREDKGGTYGAGVGAYCTHTPYSNYQVDISFGSAPERTDELTKEVWAVIDSIKAGVVSDSNMTKIRELSIRGHETALQQNQAWLGAMIDANEDGRDQRDFLRQAQLTAAVTKAQIQEAARQYLRSDRYARFTLLPASDAAKPASTPPVP